MLKLSISPKHMNLQEEEEERKRRNLPTTARHPDSLLRLRLGPGRPVGGTREPCGDTLKRGHRSAAQPLLSGPHSSHLVSTQQIQTGTQKRSKGHSELQLRRSSRALENAPVSGRTLTRPYDALRGVKCRFTPEVTDKNQQKISRILKSMPVTLC